MAVFHYSVFHRIYCGFPVWWHGLLKCEQKVSCREPHRITSFQPWGHIVKQTSCFRRCKISLSYDKQNARFYPSVSWTEWGALYLTHHPVGPSPMIVKCLETALALICILYVLKYPNFQNISISSTMSETLLEKRWQKHTKDLKVKSNHLMDFWV